MKIFFISINNSNALEKKNRLVKLYNNSTVEECDIIVALGGDGFLLKVIHDYKKFNKPMYKSIALDLRDFYAAYQQAISLEPNTHYYIEIATDKRRVILNNLHSIIMSMPPTPHESLEIELDDIIQKIGDLLQNDINQLIKVNNQNSRKNPNINTKIIEEGPEAVNDVMYSANFNIY